MFDHFRNKFAELREKAYVQLDQLEPRTKNLLNILIIVAIFSVGFNLLYKPQRRAVFEHKNEWESLNNRIFEVKAGMPDVEGDRRLLEKEKISLKVLREELDVLERQLPQQDSLPGLLGELLNQSQGYALDFALIKPIEKNGQQEYDQLNIEMQFNASYSNFVNYLMRLENLSQFIITSSIEVTEQPKLVSSDLSFKIVLTTLLGEVLDPMRQVSKVKLELLEPVEIGRSPFSSGFRQNMLEEKRNEYKVTGIISEGNNPTAIINDEVYTMGDWVGTSEIIDIAVDHVLLKEGQENIVLAIEKND